MKRFSAIHPFLFAVFPVLFLYARNMHELPLRVILVPAAISLACTTAAFAIVTVFLKETKKAGLIVSLAILLFFSYGHFLNILQGFHLPIGTLVYGPHTILIPVVALAFATGSYFIVKTRKDLSPLTLGANVTATVLVVFSVFNIITYDINTARPEHRYPTFTKTAWKQQTTHIRKDLPNIYYIIPDTYPRADILKDIYGFDNSNFIHYLTKKGFHIVPKGRANYSQTALEIASILNLNYLDTLASQLGDKDDDRKPLREMIAHSKVRHLLNGFGYSFICIKSGYWITEVKDADLYLDRDKWNGFQQGLLNGTPLLAKGSSWDGQRSLRLFSLGALAHLTHLPNVHPPYFVFAHILCPHPPFIFGPNGEQLTPINEYCNHDGNASIRKECITRKQYIKGYAGQLAFLNTQLKTTIDAILANETIPPIIILQSDTGPGAFLDCYSSTDTYFKERMCNFNAFYLPNGGDDCLYDNITPINSFRVILNYYFHSHFPLLEDRNYFAAWQTPYKFIDVTNTIGNTQDTKTYERLKNEDYFPPVNETQKPANNITTETTPPDITAPQLPSNSTREKRVMSD